MAAAGRVHLIEPGCGPMREPGQRLNLSCVCVGHDIAVIRCQGNRVAAMRQRQQVEKAPPPPMTERPQHGDNRLLLSGLQRPDPGACQRVPAAAAAASGLD